MNNTYTELDLMSMLTAKGFHFNSEVTMDAESSISVREYAINVLGLSPLPLDEVGNQSYAGDIPDFFEDATKEELEAMI